MIVEFLFTSGVEVYIDDKRDDMVHPCIGETLVLMVSGQIHTGMVASVTQRIRTEGGEFAQQNTVIEVSDGPPAKEEEKA